jgi:outer membrane protein assembly factor BamB
VGNINQHIYAYDALTGRTLWKTEVEDWATSDPVVSDGVVSVGSGNHEMREGPRHLYALDAQTGVELWKFKADARLLTAPALSPDAIYILSVSGAIYALK